MTTRADNISRQQVSKQIYSKGDAVYLCDTCGRKIRVPTNKFGVDVIQRCIITKGCAGKLRPAMTPKDSEDALAIPPAVNGLTDWSARQIFYAHDQTIESDTWNVTHNLNNKPSVTTFVYVVENGEEVLKEITPQSVTTIDENSTRITFSRSQKGRATFLATASATTTRRRASEVEPTSTIISNSGEITIATEDSASLINFTARFYSSNVSAGYVDVSYVGVDNSASILSPWVGTKRIFVGGKAFTVRSFNIRTQELASSAFSNNLIADGSSFYLTLSPSGLNKNLILLGSAPYNAVDRITTSLVDLATIDTNQPQLAISNGEVIVNPSVIKGVYPHIISVD